MADTSGSENVLGARLASMTDTVEQIRTLNERMIEYAMAEGARRLDDYERALATLVDLTEKAGTTQLNWLSAIAQMHAEFVRDVATAYAATVRILLD